MSSDTLKALTYDLLAFGCSVPVITAVSGAIQDRHRDRGLVAPIFGAGEFARWKRCIAHIISTPVLLKFPIHKAIVRALLLWSPTLRGAHRDRLLVCLMTLACMRVSEACRLQFCDVWFDFFASMGIPGLYGTAAIHITNCKNDGARRGHHPALRRATDPRCDIVTQIR